jgi:hypothetical protein
MAWQDLITKDVNELNGKDKLALRLELYNAARAAEHMAAKLWAAYWRSMGLPSRPMTAEQASMVKVVEPVKTPRSQRQSNIVETFE